MAKSDLALARELRAELRRVKAEYHERRSMCSPEEHAELSQAINDLTTRLRAAEEESRG